MSQELMDRQEMMDRFVADAARAVRERLMLDLDDKGARMIDATIRGLRAGTRQYAFRDSLIGLGEGLREVLISWGIPDRCIFTNDTPVPGYFVERKFWDFVVRDASGREQVVIEFTRLGPGGHGGGGVNCFAGLCHGWLGMIYDVSFSPRRAFTGLVAVRDARVRAKPAGRPRPAPRYSRARRHRRLERFARAGRATGLLDAMAYLDLTPDSPVEPSSALGLERFLATLFGKLESLPPGAWDVPNAATA